MAVDNVTLEGQDSEDEPMENLFAWIPNPREGGALIIILILVYIGVTLYLLAKYFILPSLDQIINKTAATKSIAGTLIIAGATCALGIVFEIVSVFTAIKDVKTRQLLGGPRFYDLTILVGLSIVMVPASLLKKVPIRPFLRDFCSAIVIIILVFLFMVDGQLEVWETAIIFLMFFVYLLVVRLLRKFMPSDPVKPAADDFRMELEEAAIPATEPQYISLAFTPGSSCWDKTQHVLVFPIKALLKLTIPAPGWPCVEAASCLRLFPLTLLLSLLWVALLGYLTVHAAMFIGSVVGIPPIFIGLIVIAPISLDLVLTILLAGRGDLDMAIHAILGRCILAICLNTGLPLLLYSVAFMDTVEVDASGGLGAMMMTMMSLLLLLLLVTSSSCSSCCRGRLIKPLALLPFLLYVFLVFVICALTYGYIEMPVDF